MTNELSKQICEISGIKPAYKCTYTGNLCPYKYEGVLKPRCPKQGIPKECEVRRKIDYIDFSKPENFVKLFELITSLEDVELRIGNYYIKQIPTHRQQTCLWVEEKDYYSENTNPIIAFLSCVFQGVIHSEYLKQAIREAEWKYE